MGNGSGRARRSALTPDHREIAVTIEATPPLDRASVFARAHGLGSREREVLNRLLAGHDTRQLAEEMTASPHTVQAHLKMILRKTSADSRAALASLALGT